MIAIGIGCRKNCAASEIVTLVKESIALLPHGVRPAGLFSLADKMGEPGLDGAAAALDLPLTFLHRDVLKRVAGEAQSRSRRIESMFGLPSIAETAALAGAGQASVLLVARRASAAATCAIAGHIP